MENNYFKKSSKNSNGKIVIKMIFIILLVFIGAIFYLIKTGGIFEDIFGKTENQNNNNLQSIEIEDNIINEENENKNVIKDNGYVVSNTQNSNTDNEDTQVVVNDKNKTNNNGIDENALKTEIISYCITVGRFDEETSELEKNTILLLIANEFFNNKVVENKGLNVSANSKYAMTADNVHLFLKELTGMKVNKKLDSYANYMRYNENSKFYSSGENSTSFKDEKYEISSLKIVPKENNEYEIIGNLTRKSIMEVKERTKVIEKEVEAQYSLNAILKENKEYTYIPYQIKEFSAVLKPGQEDNVNRLVDIEEN